MKFPYSRNSFRSQFNPVAVDFIVIALLASNFYLSCRFRCVYIDTIAGVFLAPAVLTIGIVMNGALSLILQCAIENV